MQHSTFLLLLLLLLFLAVSAAAENYVGIVRSSLSSTELKQLDYHVIECVDATHSRQPCRHYLVRSSSNRFATVTEHANVEHKPEHHERYRASHVSHELHTSAPMKRRRSSRGGGAAPQQQVKLLVRLWEPLSERAQERWAHDVQLTVTRRLDADPAVLVEHMSGDEASLSEASVWNYLATQSEVRSVESFLRPTLLDAYGNYVLQSNQRSECDVNVNSFGCTPLWDLGIDGGGQVMGSGDTGVNMRHCVFDDTDCAQSDEANEPPSCGGNYLEQPCSACVSYCLDSDPVSCAPADAGQRKVRTFRALVDDYTDNAAQHGTATMSLAVGRPQLASPLQTDLNRGAAYAARLAFTDIADDDGDLFVPLPLDTEYFSWFANQGAQVNSESWGSFSNIGYNSIAQQVDSYVWATQTHLPVFAAGNSGDPNDFGVLLLLGPEASAKNALTVGATMNELEALVLLFPSFAATYGLTLSSNTSQWSSRALAGFSSNGPTLDRRIKPDIVVPGQLNVIAWEGAPRTNTPTPECTFTSCMAGSTGTSFSAPLAAGTVVLLRQWLQQGGYRNGNTFSLPSAALLKNLMIATAQPLNGINYYEESSPFFVDKSEIDSRPELSPYGSLWAWGHGVPQLRPLTSASPGTQNVLLLDSFSSSAMAAQSTPLTTFDSIDQEQNFCVTLTLPPLSQTTFTASLVWSDFPGSLPTSGPDARVTRLVNDLDIFSMSDSCSAGLPNELANPDHLNNVERVRFAQDNAIVVSADAYHLVVVRSSRIVVSGQHFSVVLLDSDSGALLSVQPIVLNRPGAGTDLSPLHPCSVIYANCRAQIDALRDLAVSLPTPSLGPSSSGSAPLRHLGRGTWLVVVAVLVALHALGTIN